MIEQRNDGLLVFGYFFNETGELHVIHIVEADIQTQKLTEIVLGHFLKNGLRELELVEPDEILFRKVVNDFVA